MRRGGGAAAPLGRWFLQGIVLVCMAAGAALAHAGDPLLLADRTMAALAGGRQPPGMPTRPWSIGSVRELVSAACRDGPAAGGWIGLTRAPEWRVPRSSCLNAPDIDRATIAVGREVAVLVTGRGAVPLALDRGQIYRAVAAAPNAPRRWSDVGPALPDADVRLLLPADETSLWEIFAETILEAACVTDRDLRRTFDPAERRARCTALRSDGRVVRRSGAGDALAWLADAGDGAVAVLSYAELLAAGGMVTVLPVDSERPTFVALATGAYVASRTVYMTIGVWPGAADARAGVLAAAMALAGEESIGPGGTLAGRGMVPLPPAERVAVRERVLELGGAL